MGDDLGYIVYRALGVCKISDRGQGYHVMRTKCETM